MRYISKYEKFVESTLTMDAPSRPVVKPDTDTPTRTKPSRPGVVPGKRPSEEDAPLAELKQPGKDATLKDVFNRLVRVTKEEGIELKNLIK